MVEANDQTSQSAPLELFQFEGRSVASTGQLSQHHEEELKSSCISGDIIEARGYRTVGLDAHQTLIDAGIPNWAMASDEAFPGLVLPMYRVTGEYIGLQFKPAVPRVRPGTDKPVKYASPRGTGNRLDVHPSVAHLVRDRSCPLWITEGIKKSDALASRSIAAVTLTGVWNWRNQEGALGDWEDIPLRDRTVIVCFDADAPVNPQVRNAMTRLVGWLRSKGAATVYYLPVPEKSGDTPVKGVDDYLAAGGTLEALREYATEKAPEKPSSRDAAFTDAFLTDTVCEEALRGEFLFARGMGWMRYDGGRWRETDESVVVEAIRQWAKARWDDVTTEYKRDQSRDVKARLDGWRRVLESGKLRALASLSRGVLHREADEFDRDPDLLNCPNGVVDLRTGELLEPNPDYLMTKMTGVPYDPTAQSPDFDQALRALPDDVHEWYQGRIGQSFTGHTPADDLLIIQQGGGENGKSTLAVPLKRAAGSYYVLVSDRVLLGNADQHPTELMDLKGARYALMEETPEARQLNVLQLKKTVGTPDITARRIRQDPVTFQSSHALFINTNYPPMVAETDHGTWRRLAMLRFPYRFHARNEDLVTETDRLGDRTLRDRCLTQDGPAVAALAWAVRGAVEWYRGGRVMQPVPERVKADTRAWRRECDVLMAFAEDQLEFGCEFDEKSQAVYERFSEWLATQGSKPWSQKTFKARFGQHDVIAGERVTERRDRTRGILWGGVRLVPNQRASAETPNANPFS
jgi:putative DNA primase/helicase